MILHYTFYCDTSIYAIRTAKRFLSIFVSCQDGGTQSKMENKGGGNKGKPEKGGKPDKPTAAGKNGAGAGGKGADKKVFNYYRL